MPDAIQWSMAGTQLPWWHHFGGLGKLGLYVVSCPWASFLRKKRLNSQNALPLMSTSWVLVDLPTLWMLSAWCSTLRKSWPTLLKDDARVLQKDTKGVSKMSGGYFCVIPLLATIQQAMASTPRETCIPNYRNTFSTFLLYTIYIYV